MNFRELRIIAGQMAITVVRDTGIKPVADRYLRTRKRRRCAPHPIPKLCRVGVSL
jgi:hypothetical protein